MNHLNFKKFSYPLLCLLALGVFFLINAKNSPKHPTLQAIQHIQIAGQTLKIELVTTREAQQKGLGGRNEIKEDEGMLFVFDHPDTYAFWMKDMNFPIDIIWLDQEGKVVYIKKDLKPETYPESFPPPKPATYVLETVSGFSEKNNLKTGDRVLFLP